MNFELRPVRSEDLPMLTAWMNDPEVDAFWELAGSPERTAAHLEEVTASTHSDAFVGVLDCRPMSYWELYRADLDPLSEHYPARAHDGGIHLLLGPAQARGRGLARTLLKRVTATMFAEDSRMTRIVAEPDVENRRSIRAFQRAGFVHSGEVELADKRAALMILPRVVDLVGVGIGPFNLSLAALADNVHGLAAKFYDGRSGWSWHPGLLFDDARLQVPYLADLVTLVDPTSRWSFLSYLKEHDRLFPFYFGERAHVQRREYDHYCAWVANGLTSCDFGASVTGIGWDGEAFTITTTVTTTGATADVVTETTTRAENVVLGIGTEPIIPDCLRDKPDTIPATEFLLRESELDGKPDITVIGSGQTGAEIFLHLLRRQREGERLRWLTRTSAFAPMEYSKLGLEHFTPEYTRYFHGLPAEVRDGLVPRQWRLYKGISVDTINEIFDLLYERSVAGTRPDVTLMPNVELIDAVPSAGGGLELSCRQAQQGSDFDIRTEAVVFATGFRSRQPPFEDSLEKLIDRDEQGRFRIDLDNRILTDPRVTGGLYVQNAETHTHGVGTPDLGLGAHRAAVILNSVLGRAEYRLPARTGFTTFGLDKTDRLDKTDGPEDIDDVAHSC